MTPARHFVQAVCRVRAPCLHALLQRENNQKRAGLQLCRHGSPFSLEKKEREGERGREREEERSPPMPAHPANLHALHKRHETTNAPDSPQLHCASPSPSGPSYVYCGHVVGFTALSKADSTHTNHPAAHHRHRHAATGTRASRTGLAAHPAPRPRKADHLVAPPRQPGNTPPARPSTPSQPPSIPLIQGT